MSESNPGLKVGAVAASFPWIAYYLLHWFDGLGPFIITHGIPPVTEINPLFNPFDTFRLLDLASLVLIVSITVIQYVVGNGRRALILIIGSELLAYAFFFFLIWG